MRVMVTGATTPIGRALVTDFLGESETQVLAVGIEDVPADLPEDPRITYERVDLRRPRSLYELMFGTARRLCIDVVVHTAFHRRATDEGERIHTLNVEATRELLRMAERHPTIRRLVLKSSAEVYRIDPHLPAIIGEDHPLDLSPRAPQWVRDRVEADLITCTAMGLSPLEISVLRCAECLAPDVGSQLWDYLTSRVCLRPLGFDPMINVISIEDTSRALALSARSDVQGILNIPGFDTLPLSSVIAGYDRVEFPLPGFVVPPLYGLRRALKRAEFRYDMNDQRFHFGGVLDGRRAERVLDYRPENGIHWPKVIH